MKNKIKLLINYTTKNYFKAKFTRGSDEYCVKYQFIKYFQLSPSNEM